MNTPAPKTELVQFREALLHPAMKDTIRKVLPQGLSPDRFMEVVAIAVENDPNLLQADRNSLFRACIASAKRGLLPDRQEGALVIYPTNVAKRDEPARWVKLVQFLPMVQGIIKEMGKAGAAAYVASVYANDEIELWADDTGQHVKHRISIFSKEGRGELVGVYAAARMGSQSWVEPMSLEDVDRIAAKSKQKDAKGELTGPWKTDWDRMAQKSALHRLRRRLPIVQPDAAEDPELAAAIEVEPTVNLETGEIGAGSGERRSLLEQQVAPDDRVLGVTLASPPAEGAPAGVSGGQRRRPRGLQAVMEQSGSDVP